MSLHMFSIVNDLGGFVCHPTLHASIKTTLSRGCDSLSEEGGDLVVVFGTDLTPEEEGLLAGVVNDYNPLEGARAVRFKEINARTVVLIAEGFEFPPPSGAIFSLSIESQSKLLGMDQLRADPVFTYPVTWNTFDDLGAHELVDADAVHTFVLEAVRTYRVHIDSGSALKAQLRSASTQAELDAVVDNRRR